MKVLCIDDTGFSRSCPHPNGLPIKGNIYNVVIDIVYTGFHVYELEEFPPFNNELYYYKQYRFIPISDTTIDELLKELNYEPAEV